MKPSHKWPPASLAKTIQRHPVLRPLQRLRWAITLVAIVVIIILAIALGVGLGLGLGHTKKNASAYCSDEKTYQLDSITAPIRGHGNPGSARTWNLSIDDTESGYKQTIAGFGATVTDATVSSFSTQSNATLKNLLKELMTDAGASFSLMRHTIGSSDLSSTAYTYDDNDGKVDESLSGFALGSQGTAMAQLLSQMKSLNPSLRIVGSSWSAPGWMKLNGALDGNTTNNNLNDGFLTSGGVGSTGYSNAFAQYFVKYIQAYQNFGVDIDAITIQNEPLNSKSGYPTMYVYSNESAHLIGDYVAPALKKAGLETSVWAFDDNTDSAYYPQDVVNYAGQYVKAVAWHCYASPANWTVLTEFHNQNPDVEQYMTECWTSESLNWTQAVQFTMGPLQNWANGVTAWTLGANQDAGPHLIGGCDSCNGLVTTNANANYTLSISYYMIAQFSKFMPPGARVLQGNGSYTYPNGNGIQSVASLNPDGSRTVVIENRFGNDIYVTADLSSGATWSGNIPASSVTTWVLPSD
ncbi:glycoside hydrolase superfamily [Talaromyces proteolyticus]|uniref:glucan endo-1,6-beta-glucosidase n=1 Tax=Talaromyces proteolyticus TaxID=1131652 RepID=A0AAD4Q4G4_9EURO|nr:glycoside hydrolase superfamily [Talaromyces proteolyticus]KAH8703069.1 glycoside hydrolase superfamily [Talaromyces proteolyticus]